MGRRGDRKGQITIEAILVFGILIILFLGISVPLAFKAKRMATDTAAVADARFALEQLAGAAKSISTPGEKRTLEVYLPGYTSVGKTEDGVPLERITSSWRVNGTHLKVSIQIERRSPDGELRQNETFSMEGYLGGDGWVMEPIDEAYGNRYVFEIYWKNLTWRR
jgi:Flp pilus assembly protein TadG